MIPAWMAKNPLASLLGIVGAIAVLAAGVQTVRLAFSERALAAEKLAFSDFKRDLAERSAEVARAAAQKSNEQAERLANDFLAITANATEVKAAIHAARSSGACERDPKWRATVDGVQRILDQGNPGR